MTDNPVDALMEACGRRDVDAIVALFTEDALYHNIPLQAVTGRAAIRAVLEPFLGAASEVQFVVHNRAQGAGGIVMNERTDRFLINGQWTEVRVMGVFETRGGLISAWRDYFDMEPFRKLGF